MKISGQSVSVIWVTPDPEKAIEQAGRTCYKSEDKITDSTAARFAEQMTTTGHHAMIEHASASLRIVTDRGISHEIVRHRLASYAQESTRYCNYSGDKFANGITVICPSGMEKSPHYEAWYAACELSESTYLSMVHHGVKPEIARSVLPTCLKTEIVMTANFREWRHFIRLRGSKAGHPQIKTIARDCLNLLMGYAPNVFGDLVGLFDWS